MVIISAEVSLVGTCFQFHLKSGEDDDDDDDDYGEDDEEEDENIVALTAGRALRSWGFIYFHSLALYTFTFQIWLQ